MLRQEQLGQLVVVIRHRRDHVVPGGPGLLEPIGRDLLLADVLAVVAVEEHGLHADQIDDPLEVGLFPDRQLQGDGVVAQLLAELVGHAGRIGPRPIELVDERDAGNVVATHLAVDRIRL